MRISHPVLANELCYGESLELWFSTAQKGHAGMFVWHHPCAYTWQSSWLWRSLKTIYDSVKQKQQLKKFEWFDEKNVKAIPPCKVLLKWNWSTTVAWLKNSRTFQFSRIIFPLTCFHCVVMSSVIHTYMNSLLKFVPYDDKPLDVVIWFSFWFWDEQCLLSHDWEYIYLLNFCTAFPEAFLHLCSSTKVIKAEF